MRAYHLTSKTHVRPAIFALSLVALAFEVSVSGCSSVDDPKPGTIGDGPYVLCVIDDALRACPEDRVNSVDACEFGDKRVCECDPVNSYTMAESGVEHCWRDGNDELRWEHACWRDVHGGDEGYLQVQCADYTVKHR